MADKPLLSVIVANWNTTRYMNEKCIPAVRKHTEATHEIIVVDGKSNDATPEEIGKMADATVMLPDNKGPGRAWNRGVSVAQGAYICILNSDAVVIDGCLDKMLRRAMQPDAGIVGCLSNKTQKHSERPAPIVMPDLEIQKGQFISFVCVIIPREVFEKVGPIDEQFVEGMFEDVDYNNRVRDAGYKVIVAGDAWCWHELSLSYRRNNVNIAGAQAASRRRYAAKRERDSAVP